MKRRKSLLALLAAAALCVMLAVSGAAAGALVRDETGLFDADTLTQLEQAAQAAADGHDCGVYFALVDGLDGTDVRTFAKDYYTARGLGSGADKSGILFLVSAGARQYVTVTYGGGIAAFTDYRIGEMEEEILPALSESDWAGAARTYLSMAERSLDYYAQHGEPIDVDNDLGPEGLIFVIGIPAAIAAVVCGILASAMRTARPKTEADDYTPGLCLHVQRDIYTHTTQERVYDPPEEEKNDSSSGGSSVDSDGFGGSSGGSF